MKRGGTRPTDYIRFQHLESSPHAMHVEREEEGVREKNRDMRFIIRSSRCRDVGEDGEKSRKII
jgi:hypothetical protein